MCDIQDTCTPKELLYNLRILFGLSQVSSQDTTIYIGMISNLIYRFKYGGQDFSTPLMNLISIQYLDPTCHQRFLDGYEFGSLDWSSKYLN